MKKTILQRIIIGVKLGWNTSNLPDNVLKFHLNPVIRVLRVIGGFCIISLLSGRLKIFPHFITIIAIFFACIYFIYIIYITIIKFKETNKVLRSNKFDIRNSPLDRLIKICARVIYCAKIGCETTGYFGVGLGIMLGLLIDQVLENGNKPLLFRPYFNQGLDKLIPSGNSNSKLNNNFLKGKENKDQQSVILSIINSLHEQGPEAGFSQDEIKDVTDMLNSDISILTENQVKIKENILKEIEELTKSDNSKNN